MPSRSKQPTHDAAQALRSYAAGLEPDELVELVLSAAAESDEVMARLHAAMASATGDVSALRSQVRRLLPARRFLDWRGSNAYARTACEVVPLLTDLVEGGQATASIALIEDAFGRINRLLLHADDSSGVIGDIAHELLALHVRACAEGSPDPRKLARWIIAVGDHEGGFFNPAVDDYATALGPTGVAAYRKIIEDRWSAGDRTFALMYAKRRLARLDRDVDALVATTHPGAPDGIRFTEVARELFEIGLREEGLAFAERAISVGPTLHPGQTAYDLAAVEHVRRGEVEEALRLQHEALRRSPTAARYAHLRATAEEVGAWPAEQPAARETVAASVDVLVSVMLDDDDIDAAWKVAQGERISSRLWKELARARALTHPADALPVLEDLLHQTLEKADPRAYRKGIKRLRELAELYERVGEPERLDGLVTELRTTYARRPTFLRELDRAGLG